MEEELEKRKQKWLKKVEKIGTKSPVRYCNGGGCTCAYHGYCWKLMFLESERLKKLNEDKEAHSMVVVSLTV